MTRFWEGQTDGVTALLDLLSPLATQVKKLSQIISKIVKKSIYRRCMSLYKYFYTGDPVGLWTTYLKVLQFYWN